MVVSFFYLGVGIVLCQVDRLGQVRLSHRDGRKGELVERAPPIACDHVETRVAMLKRIALIPLTASGTGSLVTGNGPVVCFGDSYTRRTHAHIGMAFGRDIGPLETLYSTWVEYETLTKSRLLSYARDTYFLPFNTITTSTCIIPRMKHYTCFSETCGYRSLILSRIVNQERRPDGCLVLVSPCHFDVETAIAAVRVFTSPGFTAHTSILVMPA